MNTDAHLPPIRGLGHRCHDRRLRRGHAFLPSLLLAVVLLLAGWLGAGLARVAILRSDGAWTRSWPPSTRAPRRQASAPAGPSPPSSPTWRSGCNRLRRHRRLGDPGLLLLASWLEELLSYLPRLLISAAILFIGYLVSRGMRELMLDLAGARDLQHGQLLAQVVSGLVLAFALLLALDQLGLDVDSLKNIIVLAFAAFFGGTALAFGMGGADAVRNIMASHYLRRMYQPGLLVRVGGQEGEILELTAVGVLPETEEGQQFVPARVLLGAGRGDPGAGGRGWSSIRWWRPIWRITPVPPRRAWHSWTPPPPPGSWRHPAPGGQRAGRT
ncbi:MAG: hypothetical protein U5S82_03210 [Gammaproteobacteria bacterium]|nr:hypothetical protein [Gammaproteobacteria bacterium]